MPTYISGMYNKHVLLLTWHWKHWQIPKVSSSLCQYTVKKDKWHMCRDWKIGRVLGFINNLCWVHVAIFQVHSCLWSFCCDFLLSCCCSFLFRAHRVLIPTTTTANILWTLDRGLTTSSGMLVRVVQLPVSVFSYSAFPYFLSIVCILYTAPCALLYRPGGCTQQEFG